MEKKFDIFISYRNDENKTGSTLAGKLKDLLAERGYETYYNTDEQHSGSFPERIKEAVLSATDLLLLLTAPCLQKLLRNEKIDWVREELLIARKANKNIIPLLVGVEMPSDRDIFPEELRFLPDLDAVILTDPIDKSPLDRFLKWVHARPTKGQIYKDVFNSNPLYKVNEDFCSTLEKAKCGEAKAMYELANMYYYGFTDEEGTSQRNFESAYRWFKKLSEGNSEYKELADSMIGKMYYRGRVPREKQNFEKSFEYHMNAASKSGYSLQQSAFMMTVGLGCTFDYETAEQHYLAAIEKNNQENFSVGGLAQLYLRYGEFQKAADLYESVIHRFPESAYHLGCLYASGVLDKNKQPNAYKAAIYFHYAIEHKNCPPNAYYQLGLLYFRGTNGFISDHRMAKKYFEAGAERNHGGSQYMAGYYYEHGLDGVFDYEKAIYYYTCAVENGMSIAAAHLSLLYQIPAHANYQKAFEYAKLGAENGDREAEFVYANLLFMGRGCQEDINSAYEMYKKAEIHGCDQARFMIERIDRIIEQQSDKN